MPGYYRKFGTERKDVIFHTVPLSRPETGLVRFWPDGSFRTPRRPGQSAPRQPSVLVEDALEHGGVVRPGEREDSEQARLLRREVVDDAEEVPAQEAGGQSTT